MLPLPNRLDGTLRAVATSGNHGLRFNKFVDGWGMQNGKYELLDEQTGKKRKGKQIWIDHFAGQTLGNSVELARCASAIAALAMAQSAGSPLPPLKLKTVSRFVTGLGYDHDTENGFVWHHTLGVPFLPASGLKGMMRAFADHWQALGTEAEHGSKGWTNRIVELFGNYGDDDAQMGRLIVFDALPIAPVKLVAEILTPHDGGWRLNGPVLMKDARGDNLVPETPLSPGDWHNPVPVPFLAVETANEFQFALGLTRHGTPDDLAEGYILLEAALQWMGFGAKTASGFGRFMSAEIIAAQNEDDKSRAKQGEEQAALIIRQAELSAKAAKAEAAANWVPKTGEIVKQLDEDRPNRIYVEIVEIDSDGDFKVVIENGRDPFPVEKTNCEYAATSWQTLKRK